MEKIFFLHLLNKKRNSFCLAGYSARNPGFLLIITGWWSESGKVIWQDAASSFFSGAVEKFVRQRWVKPPIKTVPYAHEPLINLVRLSLSQVVFISFTVYISAVTVNKDECDCALQDSVRARIVASIVMTCMTSTELTMMFARPLLYRLNIDIFDKRALLNRQNAGIRTFDTNI